MAWWIRPLVRLIAALLLPVVVPAVITAILWALPGDPVEILCPPGICTGQEELARHWHMNDATLQGHTGVLEGVLNASGFYKSWITGAFTGDFGPSIRVQQGMRVNALLLESIPWSAALVALSVVPVLLFSVLASFGWLPRSLDPLWQGLGLVPSVILALLFAAGIEINYGALSYDGFPGMLRLAFGAIVLGVADGTLAGAILGTRSIFDEEIKQRYIQIALLRGESPFFNAIPNITPALIGQFRGRVLHILSGAVIVEVVLGIPGIGELLWDGTLLQDFFIVLAAAWVFSLLSGFLLMLQAVAEIAVEVHIRRAPAIVLPPEPIPGKA